LANLTALTAAPAPLRATGADILATVFQAGKFGFPVSGPFGGPSPLGAVAAQPPAGLVRVAAASRAQTPRDASFGSLAGSPVLGLAGLGIPDALDAGRATPGGAVPVCITSLLGARFADRPSRRGWAVAAAWA